MADSSSSASGGIGFCGMLTIVFIVLKLIGKIDWSWWWVLSPVWILTILVLTILIAAFGTYMVLGFFERRRAAKRRAAR
jgi:hypothetical protein